MQIFRQHRFLCGIRFVAGIFVLVGLSTRSLGDERNPLALELFEKHIRPTLIEQCIRCHGPKKQQGGLRLDSSEWLSKGGDSGEIVTPGDPDDSILIDAIRYNDPSLEMPPKGKLSDKVVRAFERWVKLGAADPRVAKDGEPAEKSNVPSVQQGREFWSFQAVKRLPPPSVDRQDWAKNDIDYFVLSRLEKNGLIPATPADKPTLIRRVFYDLIGLPPTTDQIESFVNDSSPDAFDRLVDQLLESEHFGERWGRHWLDVVRFAESSGGGRTLLFPNAWRYRDYVIDSLNDDVPYDQFVREQIAGDLLPAENWQDRRRKLTATAYLLLGPTNYELQDKDVLEMDVVDEQLDTFGKSMMGMTIGCARCHDHKFDPIPAHDYYALAGIFKSTKAMIHSNVSTWNKVPLPVPPEQEAQIKANELEIEATEKLIADTKEERKRLGATSRDKKRRPSGQRDILSESIKGIVIDDEDAELVGAWTPSTSSTRFVNGKYIHDGTTGKGQKQAIFHLDLKAPAVFEVRVGYSPFSNRSTKVPIHIHHADGETVVRINQQNTPEFDDAFQSVGVYEFDPAMDPRVVISNEGTEDGVVIADSVVLVETDLAPLPTADQVDFPENIPYIVQDPKSLPGVVVDDTNADLVGEWKHSVHTPPFVGASYIHDLKEGKGEKSATFTPNLPKDGLYEVRVSHNTNVRRASNVPITVRHADGETVVHINENEPAPIKRLFRSLGEFRFNKGKQGSVTFSSDGTDGKYVIVDSVQFIPAGNDAEMVEHRRKELDEQIQQLETRLADLKKKGVVRPIAMATDDDDDAGDIHLAIRGVVHNKGPMVPRGVMQVVSEDAQLTVPEGESGRRELAMWVASDDHPLTARVMANRIWYWLTDRGIVASVDNFGTMGDRPTHPLLLDHLANSLVDNGWSIKSLIRQIVTSRTYQMSSDVVEHNYQVDPENRLFWRMNRKRLRAEDIRDSLLFVGGNLDEQMGGPNVKGGTKSEYGYKFNSVRRSVYVPVFRNTLPEIFEVFDFADPNIQRGHRSSSTIASQALLMMNHPFVIQQSQLAAGKLAELDLASNSQAIETAYLQVIGRRPNPEEREIADEFVERNADNPRRWAMLYQALFGCVDFRYLN